MVARADDAADDAAESGGRREGKSAQVVQDDSSGTAEEPDHDPCDGGDKGEAEKEAEGNRQDGEAYGNEPLKRRAKQSNDEAENQKRALKAPLTQKPGVEVMGGKRLPDH